MGLRGRGQGRRRGRGSRAQCVSEGGGWGGAGRLEAARDPGILLLPLILGYEETQVQQKAGVRRCRRFELCGPAAVAVRLIFEKHDPGVTLQGNRTRKSGLGKRCRGFPVLAVFVLIEALKVSAWARWNLFKLCPPSPGSQSSRVTRTERDFRECLRAGGRGHTHSQAGSQRGTRSRPFWVA